MSKRLVAGQRQVSQEQAVTAQLLHVPRYMRESAKGVMARRRARDAARASARQAQQRGAGRDRRAPQPAAEREEQPANVGHAEAAGTLAGSGAPPGIEGGVAPELAPAATAPHASDGDAPSCAAHMQQSSSSQLNGSGRQRTASSGQIAERVATASVAAPSGIEQQAAAGQSIDCSTGSGAEHATAILVESAGCSADQAVHGHLRSSATSPAKKRQRHATS